MGRFFPFDFYSTIANLKNKRAQLVGLEQDLNQYDLG